MIPAEGSGPRRLIVLRHGETTHNAEGIWQGQLNSPLSERGEAQARAAAVTLAAYGPSRVISSDLSRAERTGAAVADHVAVPLTTDARLREIHAGDWQGMTGADVRAGYPEDMERMLRGDDFQRGGHGESLADVARRCRDAVAELLETMRAGETVVLATHGVSARALVADLVGLGQREAWLRIGGLGNCRWAEVVEGQSGWRIQAWNVGAHGDAGTDALA